MPRGMLLDSAYFGDTSNGYADARERAFDDFTSWRRRCKIPCSQRRFTPKSILRDNYGFCLNAKGYNARVICEWLLEKMVAFNADGAFRDLDDRSKLAEIALTLCCIGVGRTG